MQNKDITEQNMAEMPLHNYEGAEMILCILALHVSSQLNLRYVLSPSFSALSDLSPFIIHSTLRKICLGLPLPCGVISS
jgi:hypothetical protein